MMTTGRYVVIDGQFIKLKHGAKSELYRAIWRMIKKLETM